MRRMKLSCAASSATAKRVDRRSHRCPITTQRQTASCFLSIILLLCMIGPTNSFLSETYGSKSNVERFPRALLAQPHASVGWSSHRQYDSSNCCRRHQQRLFAHSHSKNGYRDHRSSWADVIPRHVAIVCDGNSRWARARNLPSAAGHAAGADRLVQVLDALRDAGVNYCTMYGFSTENWKRPEAEIHDILMVMEQTARRFYHRAVRENVRVRILGDLTDDRIPKSLSEILYKLEHDTRNAVDDRGRRLTLCLAVNYGGRQDILNATKRLAARVLEGTQDGDITEEDFASLLSTSGTPDPDLVIRTSGESRVSNFLLWNIAYAELYFTDVLWPDFDETCVESALQWYAKRRRRFGAREIVEAQ